MGLKVQLQFIVISPERIKVMDEQGIDVEALSLNPSFGTRPSPTSRSSRQAANEKLGRDLRGAAGPFRRLESVALQHP